MLQTPILKSFSTYIQLNALQRHLMSKLTNPAVVVQVKTLRCKAKAVYQLGPSSHEWKNVLWSDERHCYQHNVQKPASVMAWGGC